MIPRIAGTATGEPAIDGMVDVLKSRMDGDLKSREARRGLELVYIINSAEWIGVKEAFIQ